jgi:hypothetical protein
MSRQQANAAETSQRQVIETRRRNLKALVLSVLPGLGQSRMGYPLAGSILFCLFLFAINGVFLGKVLLVDPKITRLLTLISTPLAILLWLFGVFHTWRISFGRNRPRLYQRRRELLQRSLTAYLKNQLHEARRVLKRAIRYDYDWDDAALLFHLGVIELRLADQALLSGDEGEATRRRRAAIKAFGRYINRDPKQTWKLEIFEECRKSGVNPPRRLKF